MAWQWCPQVPHQAIRAPLCCASAAWGMSPRSALQILWRSLMFNRHSSRLQMLCMTFFRLAQPVMGLLQPCRAGGMAITYYARGSGRGLEYGLNLRRSAA